MNIIRHITTAKVAVAALLPLLATSCMKDEDSYSAGFPVLHTTSTFFFANNTVDSLYVMSYGDWQLTKMQGADWCQLVSQKGKGGELYVLPIPFMQNTTGMERRSRYRIADLNHGGDANAEWDFRQLATRGNGALGNAPLVKAIHGSDGTEVAITYDEQARPLSLTIAKNGTTLHNLTISYQDDSHLMTVNNGRSSMTSLYSNDYEAQELLSETDTVLVRSQEYYNMMTSGLAFNIEERQRGGHAAHALLYRKLNTFPDSLRTIDSLLYQMKKDFQVVCNERLGLQYTKQDNRCQSVDANALLLGADYISPYMLLSLFPYTRSSYIVEKAGTANEADRIEVAATLRPDKSVDTMTVSRKGQAVVYTFEY